jgi:putative SOS response-associated peptidase YedK
MGGRYRRRSDKQRIAEWFAVSAGLGELYLEADDDAAPGSIQPVIRISEHGERQIVLMRWGFKREDGKLLFNARPESIKDLSFWRKSFSLRRCIVPADSFFEWQKTEQGQKPKFEFTLRGGKPFGMAGLWAPWKNPKTNQWEDTFAIVTVEANETMTPVHNRQPAILAPRDYQEYLENTERPPIHLLRVFPDDEMRTEEIGQELISDEQTDLFDNQ